jgi:ribosomal-protein-alanine N-acetyltransferase
MREEHLDRVLAIEAKTAPAGWTRGVFRNELALTESRCYVVLELPPHGVVAFGGMQMLASEAHITTLAVDPAHRRRRLATCLLVELLRRGRAMDARSATLEVRLTNIAAQRLYAGLGFRPVGVRRRYYEGTDDALIMWAHDIDGPEFDRLLVERAATVDLDVASFAPPHGGR